jgi:predicted acyltransferase
VRSSACVRQEHSYKVAANVSAPDPQPPSDEPRRVRSIDALRGMAITLMVLVNDAGEAPAAPDFLKHVPPDVQGMTPADVEFPAFLFLVGASAPLALDRQRASGASTLSILRHVLVRTLGLLIMGVFMIGRADHVGIKPQLWTGLMYVCFFATWNVLVHEKGWKRTVGWVARVAGILGLIGLALTFRGPAGERLIFGPLFDPAQTVWLYHGWWEILGTIGWVYLFVSLAVLVLGRRPALLALGVPLGIGLFALDAAGFLAPTAEWRAAMGAAGFLAEPLFALDAHVSLAHVLGPKLSIGLAGASLGALLVGKHRASDTRVLQVAAASAFMMAIAGLALQPIWGVNKHASTPTWALYSAAITAATFALVHWAMDVKGWTGWARIVRSAGASPLTAYLLHPLLRGFLLLIPGLGALQAYKAEGVSPVVAVLGALVMTAFVVWATGWLGRRGVRVEV